MNRELVGQQLVEAQVISSKDLGRALDLQRGEGGRVGSILVRMGALSEATLLEFLSQRYGVPSVELGTCRIDETLRDLVPIELLQHHLVCPVKRSNSRLTVAMVDPSNSAFLDELRFRTGLHIVPMVATETDVRLALTHLKNASGHQGLRGGKSVSFSDGKIQEKTPEPDRLSQMHNTHATMNDATIMGVARSEGPHSSADYDAIPLPVSPRGQEKSAVEVVNALIGQAIDMEASDIHIEPLEKILRVRVRLDGELRPMKNLPKELHQPLIARLKILSDLDIAERRLPQDGRMKLDLFPRVDIRVAVLPCLFGEKAVLRLLNQSRLALHVTNLGMEQPDLDLLTNALENPYGMILVTGPTGSGKTTTLYSALQFLNTPHMNIVTVEDPVEYQIQGINQLQIHEDIGLTFATGLRAFLRQDPDVMMVGEIRDRETAQIAIQAALTGHRVLSTLHTMNAPGAIARLIEMGIEPFLVASALSLIVGQRLVRTICDSCREPEEVQVGQLLDMGFRQEELNLVNPMKGKGCGRCHHTGFKGRLALFELLPISERLHTAILARGSASDLKHVAQKEGFRTLRQAGLTAVKKGWTTAGEILSETGADTPRKED